MERKINHGKLVIILKFFGDPFPYDAAEFNVMTQEIKDADYNWIGVRTPDELFFVEYYGDNSALFKYTEGEPEQIMKFPGTVSEMIYHEGRLFIMESELCAV